MHGGQIPVRSQIRTKKLYEQNVHLYNVVRQVTSGL